MPQHPALHQTGSRHELVAQLRDMADSCLAGERLAAQARQAAVQLESGADSARAGHALFEVTAHGDVC